MVQVVSLASFPRDLITRDFYGFGRLSDLAERTDVEIRRKWREQKRRRRAKARREAV